MGRCTRGIAAVLAVLLALATTGSDRAGELEPEPSLPTFQPSQVAPPTPAASSSPSSFLLPHSPRSSPTTPASTGRDEEPGRAPAAGPETQQAAPRLLLIALDGVPFTAVRDAIDAAHRAGRELFAGYAGPVPLVSSFPSTTHPAMAGILEPLGVGPSPGYEARFFDRTANRRRGGGPISYHRIDVPWKDFFDWRDPSLASGMVTKLRPVKGSIADVRRALAGFARSDAPRYAIYLAATDGLGHLHGPAAIAPVLEAIDAELARFHADPRVPPFHTILFSDHGMAGGEPLADVHGAVLRRLREAGLRLRGGLERPGDAVVSSNGMISSFEIHTDPDHAALAAEAVTGLPGVDLCVHRDDGGWMVDSARGRARFERRSGPAGAAEWRYLPETGDPLLYAPIAARLAGESTGSPGPARVPAESWFSGDAWFAATWDAAYPDALHRLARAFDLVTNPATVACSCQPGYLFAARRTRLAASLSIGHLRWTHGALLREPSWGVLLTDLPGWRPPQALRFDDALAGLAPLGQE